MIIKKKNELNKDEDQIKSNKKNKWPDIGVNKDADHILSYFYPWA